MNYPNLPATITKLTKKRHYNTMVYVADISRRTNGCEFTRSSKIDKDQYNEILAAAEAGELVSYSPPKGSRSRYCIHEFYFNDKNSLIRLLG